MKLLRYFLRLLACTAGFAGPAMADAPPSVSLPEDIKALAPADMIPIFYAADGSDAVMVLETKDDHPENSSHDPYAHPQTRLLIMLRKELGTYKEIDSSDKVMACSTCGRNGFDPFVPTGIKLKNGKLFVEQDYTAVPSMAEYHFSYDPKLGHWMVISATNTDIDQNMSGDLIRSTPKRLSLPKLPLLANFNPGWHAREPGLVLVADDKADTINFLTGDTAQELDKSVKETCTDKTTCHEVVRQTNGCAALAKDGTRLFAGKSSVRLNGVQDDDAKQQEAADQAMKSCTSSGGTACKVVRKECAEGPG